MNTFVYKIRNKLTGRFSTGGLYPKWTKTGKSWRTKTNLSRHLTLLGEKGVWHLYKNCEILEYEVILTSSTPLGPQEPDKNQPALFEIEEN